LICGSGLISVKALRLGRGKPWDLTYIYGSEGVLQALSIVYQYNIIPAYSLSPRSSTASGAAARIPPFHHYSTTRP
jgi:hypothetical protein